MKPSKLFRQLLQLGSDNSGYVLTLSVLIISSVISVVVISTGLSSLTNLNKNSTDLKETKVKQFTQGCIQEALIQVNRDSKFTSSTFNFSNGTCKISVSGTGNTKTISATGTVSNYHANLQAEVELDPFKLVNWDDNF